MIYDNETWCKIPRLSWAQASDYGRIMVTPWLRKMPYGGVSSCGGMPTFGVWAKDQKRFIVRWRGGTYKVARLVCETFHGHPPFDRAVAMHIDEDSRNNRADNLRWGTQRENLNCPGFIEYCRARVGDDSPIIKGRAKKVYATPPSG